MNILISSADSIYTSDHVGGAETSLALIGKELSNIGHNVYYITYRKHLLPGINKHTDNKVKVYIISNLRLPLFDKLFLSASKKLKKLVRNYLLAKVLIRNNIQIAYAFGNILHHIIDCKISNKAIEFPIVLRVAGIDLNSAKNQSESRKGCFNNYLEKIDAYNFQSQNHRDTYLKIRGRSGMQLPPKKELIADIGIHPEFFRQKQVRNNSTQVIQLACVMRFSERKRQDLLIKALTLLNHKNVHLTFYGDGPLISNMKKLSEDLGVSNKNTFYGFIEKNSLIQKLLRANIYLHPVDYEPQSKSLWESMALQIPVIASNVSTINQQIIHKQNGLLANNDPESWAKCIDYCISNINQLDKIAKQAFLDVSIVADSNNNVRFFDTFFKKITKLEN
jgi:glycosyltransferase involved in cell wall biosynthesis